MAELKATNCQNAAIVPWLEMTSAGPRYEAACDAHQVGIQAISGVQALAWVETHDAEVRDA